MWTDEEIEEAERQLAEEDGDEEVPKWQGDLVLWGTLIVFLLPQFGFLGDGNFVIQGFKGIGLVLMCMLIIGLSDPNRVDAVVQIKE